MLDERLRQRLAAVALVIACGLCVFTQSSPILQRTIVDHSASVKASAAQTTAAKADKLNPLSGLPTSSITNAKAQALSQFTGTRNLQRSSGFGGGARKFLAAMAAAGGFGLWRAAGSVEHKEPSRKPRVLILLSDTGGGHRASARALVDAFNVLRPGMIDAEIVDVWTEHAPKPFNKFVENYQYLAQRPLLWRGLYGFGRWGPFRRSSNEWTNIKCNKPFRELIESHDPDMIISVHPLCQFVPLRVLRRNLGKTKKIPFVTVVTDLASAHPTWFHKDVDKCFVATEQLAKMARYHGIPNEKISVHGLPIRPEFWSPVQGDAEGKPGIRSSMGLDANVPAVLVVGGGDGVGGIVKVAKAIGDKIRETSGSTPSAQMIVICGKNAEAKAELENYDWGGVKVKVEGFTDKMSELMAASDCIVTKAGPGTITEATIRGLPVMLSSYLPGQERGNVDFVVKGEFGAFSRKPEVIADTVCQWVQDKDKLSKMSATAKSQSNPKATFEIAEEIIDMLSDNTNSETVFPGKERNFIKEQKESSIAASA